MGRRGRITFGVAAGILSLGVDGLAGIGLVHLLFKYLPDREAGFWSLVTVAGTFLLLLPNSLSPAISRTVAQKPEDPASRPTDEDHAPVRAAVRITQWLLILGAVGVFLGYLWPVARAGSLSWPALLAWILYTAGLLLTFEGLGHIAILNGFGEVGWDKVIRIATSTAGFLASWWILHHRGGLGGLGAVFLMQGAILLLFALVVSRRRTFRTLGPLWPALLPRGLLSEGAKLLALAGAGYVVSNSGFIVIEKTFGLEFVARYSALTRVGMVLASASALLPQMIYPYAARAWTGGDVSRFRKLYWSGLAGAMAACLTGAASVWLLSDQLFPRWLGPANYLGAPVLLWVLLYQVVCVHHMSHCTPVLAAAGNAFILPALFNAILVPPCVHWACRRWGIIGVPAGTLLGTTPPSIWVVVICLRFVLTARPKA